MRSSRRSPRIIRHAAIDSGKLLLAKYMRRVPTAAEAVAWEILRGRQVLGLKFRRQQIIAGFVVDFYCASARLALELDGGVHEDLDQREYDEERRAILARYAVRVVRIPNHAVDEQVLRDLLAPYARPQAP
jgi:very-short-patch-repair endonuclease